MILPTLPDRNGKKFISIYDLARPGYLVLPGTKLENTGNEQGVAYAYYVNTTTTTVISGGGGGGGTVTKEVIKEAPMKVKLAGLTRQQATYFLLDCMDEQGKVKSKFSDCTDERIGMANKLGLVNGYSNGTFKPDQVLTANDLYLLIGRFIQLTATQSK